MKNDFLRLGDGTPIFPVGLQAHNSSTGTKLLDKTVQAIRLMGGNTLESPIYWYEVEPEQDHYDTSSVKELIRKAKESGLYLVILWFGMNKNGHPNYVPEYVKLDPKRYPLATGPNGSPVMSMSVHSPETLKRDLAAFKEVCRCIREADPAGTTVIALQIENEIGYNATDMDFGPLGLEAYAKGVPEELASLPAPARSFDRTGEEKPCPENVSPWKQRFGHYAHEIFSAWHTARYVETLAASAKELLPDLTLYCNAAVQENGYEEGGACYNCGGPTTRVLDVWRCAAPHIDILAPDIYNQSLRDYRRICEAYAREDNPLFIPESMIVGESNAMNMITAVADYDAIGVAAFGAESILDTEGNLREEARSLSLTMRTIAAMSPLLLKYRGTGNVYGVSEEEFEDYRHLALPGWDITVHFTRKQPQNYGFTPVFLQNEKKDAAAVRGRCILVHASEYEFYIGGAGAAAEIRRRPDPLDENGYANMTSRASNELNYLSVEEGHFDEAGNWCVDFIRDGDEANFAQYVMDAQVIRVRMNPMTPGRC